MSKVFLETPKHAIWLSNAKKAGWTIEQYQHYLDLCAQLRAAIISEDSYVVEEKLETSEDKNYSKHSFDALIDWIVEASGQRINLDYDILYALKRKIRYVEYPFYDNMGDVPYFYRSDEDFRFEIERQIRIAANPHKVTVTINSPYYGTKAQTISAYKALLKEKESLIANNSGTSMPADLGENNLFVWARKKAAVISRLEEINDRLDCLQWRIDELEAGGEFDVAKNVLYVCQGIILCDRDNHNVACVNARLKSKNDVDIYLNVNYCTKCKRFYISYSEYLHYRALYGVLIARIVLVKDGIVTLDTDYLADQSPLNLCGYSVSMADGLSTETRQMLLSTLIRNNIIGKAEIIRYLSWFIQMNGQRYGNEIAKRKWVADLDFVREYDCYHQDTYDISDIQPYRN